MELHVLYESDENGWVAASLWEIPQVVTCGRTKDEAREMVRDALAEWLLAVQTPAAKAPANGEPLLVTIA